MTKLFLIKIKTGNDPWRASNSVYATRKEAEKEIELMKKYSIFTDPDFEKFKIKEIYLHNN